ncbi:hypothetical protein LCGC14_1366780 [marine sediment metagenome]|uniref:C2H2-type domain-containing protein n=1 Tax=marine sediment metagenome TaxID=412755 RepID=A0A0F9KSH3_9ZZZZ
MWYCHTHKEIHGKRYEKCGFSCVCAGDMKIHLLAHHNKSKIVRRKTSFNGEGGELLASRIGPPNYAF